MQFCSKFRFQFLFQKILMSLEHLRLFEGQRTTVSSSASVQYFKGPSELKDLSQVFKFSLHF